MTWIQQICKGIDKAFSVIRPALPVLPPLLLLCEIMNRPGLSAIALASAVIQRLPEAGIVTNKNPDGTPNKINQFVRIFSEEIVKEIKNNAQVTGVITPGSVVSQGTGANAGGPVFVVSTNMLPSNMNGIVR